MDFIVKVENLSKVYEVTALRNLPGPRNLPSALISYLIKGRHKRQLHVLKNITFTIKRGDFVLLLGPNGSGKTTLLKILSGLMMPTSGLLQILGVQVTSDKDLFKVRKYVAYISSALTAGVLFDPLITVKQNLELMADFLGINLDDVMKYVDLFDMKKYLDYRFGALSTGLAARILLSLNLAKPAEIYLFDEPTEALSPKGRSIFKNILRELKNRGKTVIYATHHPEEFSDIFDKLMILLEGKIMFYGDINTFIDKVFKGKNTCLEVALFEESSKNRFLSKINIDSSALELSGNNVKIYCNISNVNKLIYDLFKLLNIDNIKYIKVIPRSLEEAYLTYLTGEKYEK